MKSQSELNKPINFTPNAPPSMSAKVPEAFLGETTFKHGSWSCDQRDSNNCRNPFGCHCREITELSRRVAHLEKTRRKIKS